MEVTKVQDGKSAERNQSCTDAWEELTVDTCYPMPETPT